ncbi:hypothetical protein [Thermococcus prieurii]
MDRYRVGRTVGFFVLLFASFTFLSFVGAVMSSGSDLPFSAVVGLVLLLYAWTDYVYFAIDITYGLAILIGFLAADLEGVFYAIPMDILYLVFIYLMRRNSERLATLLFVLSVPLALVNSYLVPPSSAIAWMVVGLMAGIVENAVVEEMAEGDPIMIALYFMALGPLALVPFAFQNVTGRTLFAKENRWPVGPAMFTVAVPLFKPILDQWDSKLPDWLLYVQYHGVPHSSLGVLVGFLTLFWLGFHLIRVLSNEGMNAVEIVAGVMTAVIAPLFGLSLLAVIVEVLSDSGYTNLSMLVTLAGFVGLIVLAWKALRVPRLHYERRSSIDFERWESGIFLLADAVSLLLLFKLWSVLGHHRLALGMALLLAVWYYAVFLWDILKDKINGLLGLPRVMALGLTVPYSWFIIISAFLSGLWVGFGIGWIAG